MTKLKPTASYEVGAPVAFRATESTLVDNKQENQMHPNHSTSTQWESIAAGVSILGALIATVAAILNWVSQAGEWPRNLVSTGEPSGHVIRLSVPDSEADSMGRLTVHHQGAEVLVEPLRINRTASGMTYIEGAASGGRGKLFGCGVYPQRWCLEWSAGRPSMLSAITILTNAD